MGTENAANGMDSCPTHRYVKRAVRKPKYWDELNGYLSEGEQVQENDKEAMSAVMLGALTEIQKPDKEAADRSRSIQRSSGGGRTAGDGLVPTTRYCGHGARPCQRRVASGKVCPVHGQSPSGRSA